MKRSNKYLSIRKIGLFYNAFDDDACILHYLLGYRILDGRCGFPEQSYTKVINTLEEKKINYIIHNKEEIKKDFKNLNNYEIYLAKSRNKQTVIQMVEEINECIEKLPEDKLNKLLETIRELVHEQ